MEAASNAALLIAENEVLIREALRQELAKRYRVVAAVGNGQAAVESAEKNGRISLCSISRCR
jgi:DNA-binding NarL/FixJ family response regulator